MNMGITLTYTATCDSCKREELLDNENLPDGWAWTINDIKGEQPKRVCVCPACNKTVKDWITHIDTTTASVGQGTAVREL